MFHVLRRLGYYKTLEIILTTFDIHYFPDFILHIFIKRHLKSMESWNKLYFLFNRGTKMIECFIALKVTLSPSL